MFTGIDMKWLENRSENQSELSQKQETYQKQEKSLKEAHEKTYKRLREEYQKKLKKMKEEYESEKQEYDSKIKKLQENFKAINILIAKLKQEHESKRAEYDSIIAKLNEDFTKTIIIFKPFLDLSGITENFDALFIELKQEHEKKRAEYSAIIAKLEEDFTNTIKLFEPFLDLSEITEKKDLIISSEVTVNTSLMNRTSQEVCGVGNFSNFKIEELKKYLEVTRDSKLYYSENILRSFYIGLQTGQMVLLMGRPGTGKTSLVKACAEFFGFDCEVIPVQSNWNDRSDLLGYYNPIEKSYMSTQFLDILLDYRTKALNTHEKKFIICLDEMNLSHVEYYFAEFLSVLQEEKEDNRTVELYSRHLLNSILEELRIIGRSKDLQDINQLNDFERLKSEIESKKKILLHEEIPSLQKKYYISLCRMAKMLIDFPHRFTIPDNIIFVGTLNQDATTLDLSPKVIDRSWIIRFGVNEEKTTHAEVYLDNNIPSYDDFIKDPENKLWGLLGKYGNGGKEDIIHYSRRVFSHTFQHGDFTNWCSRFGQANVIDQIIASTVLPRIKVLDKTTCEDVYSVYSILNGFAKGFGFSSAILNEITVFDSEKKPLEIAFWRS